MKIVYTPGKNIKLWYVSVHGWWLSPHHTSTVLCLQSQKLQCQHRRLVKLYTRLPFFLALPSALRSISVGRSTNQNPTCFQPLVEPPIGSPVAFQTVYSASNQDSTGRVGSLLVWQVLAGKWRHHVKDIWGRRGPERLGIGNKSKVEDKEGNIWPVLKVYYKLHSKGHNRWFFLRTSSSNSYSLRTSSSFGDRLRAHRGRLEDTSETIWGSEDFAFYLFNQFSRLKRSQNAQFIEDFWERIEEKAVGRRSAAVSGKKGREDKITK